MHLGPPYKGPPHMAIHFLLNKTERIKRKTYKPVAPNVGPFRMLGAAIFFI